MRRILVVAAAASLAILTYGTASAAPAGKTVEIVGGESFVPNQSFTETFRFQQRTVTVRSGDTLTWHNETTDPHTISVVAPGDVPRTADQVVNCNPCVPFLAQHAPTGPDGPLAFFVDNLQPSTQTARLDSVGDSIVVAPQHASLPSTSNVPIGDTVSAVISAPGGTTLNYICAIHPWMQATIRVVGPHDRADD